MASRGVALITGCSSGFGLLAAVELARAGFAVAATMRDLGKCGPLDEAARAAGVSPTVLPLDVTSAASIARCFADVEAALGPIDVLVNNAGVSLGGFVEELTMEEVRALFETNFFGLLALTKAVLPGMRERRRGRIINLSSIGGLVGLPGLGAYDASKFAVEGLSESLRHEMLPYGVYVTLVEPGTFRTEIFDANLRLGAQAGGPSSPHRERGQHILALAKRQAAETSQRPIEVARVIARAALARRPRLRYAVGRDARVQAFAKRFGPFRLLETAIGRITSPPRG